MYRDTLTGPIVNYHQRPGKTILLHLYIRSMCVLGFLYYMILHVIIICINHSGISNYYA